MGRSRIPATILCVEDEEFLLEELQEELSSKGHNVLTATNSDEAEAILAEYRPDIVLCDVMLPGRSGFELLNDLRDGDRLAETTAFIFLTALSDREPHLEGLRAGAVDYLTKPVDLDLLHLKIENTLAFAHRLREGMVPLGEPLDVHLSRREEQVLSLLGQGARTGAIAARLEISEHTVSHYIKELYRKLGINNRADAARIAISLGLSATNRT
ncbi:response regulator (plasmid) [Paracoccus kondratievae]|uniref:DNA-binding response regulator n=1 Tax=Paracoccus kondratievae TaxID=135740 RepID=A0AAD3RUF7_9RHOB|nr:MULTISPECIES: response regulator transcription factor [Paracoccus]QFQ89680.1 response regulator [Paracoccus kondratievae]GLK64649.1 DNA-binding response regulator [Paracoccus kondratievae]SMG22608.1 two component transcriptional regulator, LuxR family [Paracoccus sp. J56]